jgi:hypothetical protein
MGRSSLSLALALVLLALGATDCTNDFRQYKFDLPPGGQGPGAAGVGGSVAGGGGTGGAGNTGGPPECLVPADCPGVDTQCRARSCSQGNCGTTPFASGTPCDENGGTVCNGTGICVPGT